MCKSNAVLTSSIPITIDLPAHIPLFKQTKSPALLVAGEKLENTTRAAVKNTAARSTLQRAGPRTRAAAAANMALLRPPTTTITMLRGRNMRVAVVVRRRIPKPGAVPFMRAVVRSTTPLRMAVPAHPTRALAQGTESRLTVVGDRHTKAVVLSTAPLSTRVKAAGRRTKAVARSMTRRSIPAKAAGPKMRVESTAPLIASLRGSRDMAVATSTVPLSAGLRLFRRTLALATSTVLHIAALRGLHNMAVQSSMARLTALRVTPHTLAVTNTAHLITAPRESRRTRAPATSTAPLPTGARRRITMLAIVRKPVPRIPAVVFRTLEAATSMGARANIRAAHLHTPAVATSTRRLAGSRTTVLLMWARGVSRKARDTRSVRPVPKGEE